MVKAKCSIKLIDKHNLNVVKLTNNNRYVMVISKVLYTRLFNYILITLYKCLNYI